MAQKGTPHFIYQRLTAFIMIPFVIWFLISLVRLSGASHSELSTWITHWWNAVPVAVLLIAGFFHMRIGLSEVIDDYIHKPTTRGMLQFLNTLFALVVGGIAVWSLIALTFIV